MIYVPPSVPLGPSLQDLYGYHDEATTTTGSIPFPYAVIVDDGTGIDTTTTTAAHELIEGATDPHFTNGNLGWFTDPPLPDPWYLILGEVADLCNYEPYAYEGTFAYQRSWSNAAAAAGGNPCVPNQGDRWEDVTADPATMPTIPKGGTATFTLTGWSTEREADWSLDYADADYSSLYASDLNVTFDRHTINNHKTATVTLHAPTNAASGDTGGIYVLSGPYARPWAVGFSVQ